MRTAFAFLALAFVSCASAYFSAGDTRSDSELLATHADYVFFNQNNQYKTKYYHFNTCNENNIDIDKIEVITHRGRTVTGNMMQGGVNNFYAVIKVDGENEANTEFKIWGRWRNGQRQVLKIDECFFVFDQYYPCARPITNYN